MKKIELINEINSVLSLLPDEQQVVVALRYQGIGALKSRIANARQQLEELKQRLAKQ